MATSPFRCTGCRGCRNTGRCVINDVVNLLSDKAAEADGIVVGSPVHYAGASGAVTSLLDRMFYSSAARFCIQARRLRFKLPTGRDRRV